MPHHLFVHMLIFRRLWKSHKQAEVVVFYTERFVCTKPFEWYRNKTRNMNDDDFKKQFELEQLAKQKQANEARCTYTDPNDGTVYEWDAEKNAWFPKVTDEFLAAYHANYGAAESGGGDGAASSLQVQQERGALEQGLESKPKPKPSQPGWFDVDDAHNTKVYVTNLPNDITEEEFVDLMSKCGLIMKDEKGVYRTKLYRNNDGTLKGDALCCYIKIESVELALSILDGYRLKDKEIHVERAKFQLKGTYDPTKKPKKKKKDKEKLKKKIEKLFDWRPEKLRGMRLKHENTVVLKNMFDPEEFEKDPTLILEYQKDLREECTKFGEVKKVVVYDRNKEGIATVTFKEPEEADACIALMNGRWFAQRQLVAETWDGRTRFKIMETEEELEERLKKWDEYLEQDDELKAASSSRHNPTYGTKGEGDTKRDASEVSEVDEIVSKRRKEEK
ncbi:17S U2 SnRNP complex component HTATSF1-like isoform X2 [Ornithodoros turicata]|uniref:17S U2 SnRNP complex component HTATSF1-like isoform X2 n=1 Tax=Ornithodoros turicata TaxID=34597 RepID=UPI003139853A